MRTYPHPAHRSENAEIHDEEGDFCAQHGRRHQDGDQVAGLDDIVSLELVWNFDVLELDLTIIRCGLEISTTLMSQ